MKNIIKLVRENPSYYVKRFKQKINHTITDISRLSSQTANEEIVNQKEFRISGLRRTGNHAIINWIIKQSEGTVVHFNDIFINENPLQIITKAIETKDPDFAFRAERAFNNPLYKGQDGVEILKREANGDFTKKDLLIYSLEGYHPRLIAKKKIQKKHKLYFGKSRKKYDIIILRDPYNLLASRLKNKKIGLKTRSYLTSFADMWVAFAREYLGETNFSPYPKVAVNYNKWAEEKAYRKQLTKTLHIPFTDAGFHEVTNYGGGSSFDGSGAKKDLDVFGRWKHYKDDPTFLKVVSNDELRHYSNFIFPELENIEKELGF